MLAGPHQMQHDHLAFYPKGSGITRFTLPQIGYFMQQDKKELL